MSAADIIDMHDGCTLDQARARWLASESARPLRAQAVVFLAAGVVLLEAARMAGVDRLALLDIKGTITEALDGLEATIASQLDDVGLEYERIDRSGLEVQS